MLNKKIKREIKRYFYMTLLVIDTMLCVKNIDELRFMVTATSKTSELPDDITKDSLLKKLKENETLTKKDKEMVRDFINYIYEYYPECNFFKFYNNLDTLKIKHKDSWNLFFDYHEKTNNNMGTYYPHDNIIKILNEYNNTTLFHELTHATTSTDYNLKYITNIDNNYCYGVNEMFCEYFATRGTNILLGYQHMDYAEAIIALTGYTYNDYCNKGLSYLEKLLNDNGLNGKEIFKYLDDVRENPELQNDTEYMKQYSINYTKELKNICYKKVIEKFNDSGYDDLISYLMSIKNIIPGDDTDFMNYVSNNAEYINNTIQKKYTYEEIKPYIIKNILLESGLVEIGKNIDISEYDLEKTNGKLELTYNDSIVELKSVKDKVSYYEDFINMVQVNENNDNLNNNRCYTVNDRGYLISHLDYNMAIMFEEYFDKVESYMISKIKKEKNIEEKINLVIGYDNEEQRPCLYYDLDDNSFKIPTKPDGDDIYSLYLYLQITDVFDSKFSEKYNLLYDKISENNKKLLSDFPKYNIDNGYQLRK